MGGGSGVRPYDRNALASQGELFGLVAKQSRPF